MKYVSIIAVLLAMCLMFAGCKDKAQTDPTQLPTDNSGVPVETEPQEVTFRHNGAVVTLPSSFIDYTLMPLAADYTFLYGDSMVGLSGIEDLKEEIDPSVTSLETYVAYRANLVGGEAVQQDGLWTLSYEDLTQNEPQMLVSVFHETERGYWIIQSYCPSDVFETHQADMWNYVKSVTFE